MPTAQELNERRPGSDLVFVDCPTCKQPRGFLRSNFAVAADRGDAHIICGDCETHLHCETLLLI